MSVFSLSVDYLIAHRSLGGLERLGKLGDRMPIVLRIDHDNAYVTLGSSFLIRKVKLCLNWLNENLIAPHINFLGYCEALKIFTEYLVELGVRGTIFFKYITVPKGELAKRLLNEGFEVGLHLYSATSFEGFLKEKGVIERTFNTTILGFSKHGDGFLKTSRKHAWRYEPEKYVRWGLRAGLRYFSGNIHDVIAKPIKYNGFVHIPQVLYVEPWARRVRVDIKPAAEYAERGHLVVALIHPRNWILFESARREFERMIDSVSKFFTFKEVLNYL